MDIIAGADEAGRGCLIGPLVLCVAFIEREKEQELKKLGARDSKTLSPTQRENVLEKLMPVCKFKLAKITAKELNELMKRYSLNEIEAQKIAEALKGEEYDELFVDSPDGDKHRFAERLKKLGAKGKITSEHKADSKFPVVSAASVCAKVTRDAELQLIKKEVGFDFGSGYTSDEVTIDFVKKNLANKVLQKYLRVKWSTLDRLKQQKLGDFEG